MLSTIAGSIWAILGFLWLLKPQALKNKLTRKMNRKIKWIARGFVFALAVMLIGSIFKAEGMMQKVAGIIGLVITAKIIFLLTAKTSEKMIGWWAQRPLVFFRIWAAFILATGLALIFS